MISWCAPPVTRREALGYARRSDDPGSIARGDRAVISATRTWRRFEADAVLTEGAVDDAGCRLLGLDTLDGDCDFEATSWFGC